MLCLYGVTYWLCFAPSGKDALEGEGDMRMLVCVCFIAAVVFSVRKLVLRVFDDGVLMYVSYSLC